MRAKKIKNKEQQPPNPVLHTNLILKNIDEVVYYVTLDGKKGKEVVFLSDKIKDILGFTKEKYLKLGKKILDYCHPDDIPVILHSTSQILKKKIKNSFRYRFFNPRKKKYIWIEETIYPQLAKKKKLTGYFGVSRNIEKEKKFEQQIIEDEKKFRLLAENSSDIIFHFQFKPKLSYTYVSPSVERILGYSPEAFYKDYSIGFKIIHPDEEKKLLGSEQKLKGAKPIIKTFDKLTARYRAKNGKTVWLENRYSPVYDGKEIVALHCVSRDITEEKQKEQELADSKTQLSNILSNLPGIAYRSLNDKNWTMKFISSGSHELTGYKAEDFIDNKKRTFASVVWPQDRITVGKEMRKALLEKKSFEVEYRLVHKDGSVKWIWEKGEGVYNDKGRLQYIEGFISDISARKKVENELNQEWINYRNLIESLPSGIFIHINGKILFGNKAAYEISEIDPRKKPEDVSLLDFLRPEDRPLAFDRIKKAMAGETLPYADYRVKGSKGTEKDVRVKAMPIIFNSIPAVQIIIQDITIEKKLEEEKIKTKIAEQSNKDLQHEINLRIESEQKLNAIFESTTHLIWTVSKSRQLISFNQKYYNSVLEVCGKSIYAGMRTVELKDIFSDKDYAAIRAAQEKAFGGVHQKIDVELNAIDGKTYYREMNFYPIKINGEINEIAAVAQDTTERRNYEKRIIDQTIKLKAIFDSGNHRIWTVNRNFELTSFNQNFANAFSLAFGREPEMNTSALELVKNTEYYDFWESKYKEVLNGKGIEFETRHKIENGKIVYGQVFFHPIHNEKGQVTEIAALSQDITDRKNAEKQILDQSAKLKAIFDSGNQHIWTIDREFKLTSFNKSYADAVFYLSGSRPEINKSVFSSETPSSYYETLKEKYSQALKGKSVEFEISSMLPNGKEKSGQVFLHPIFNEKNEVTEVAAIAQDITLRKDHEKQIVEQSARLKAIFESGSQLMWTVNRDIKLTSFNKNFTNSIYELYGAYPELNTRPGEHDRNTDANEYNNFWENKYKSALSGEIVEFYTERSTISGKKTHRYIFLHPIYDAKNQIVEVSALGYDISAQKKAEEEILNSLKEKDVLLKEVHHRVKNNLQVISSILNLQTAYLKDRGTINILKECQNRIKTMAFIHESLYQNKDFSQINFSEYIVTLVKNLFYSFETNQQKIRANFDVDTIFLNLDISIPCGLIVNELVSNALKYAFVDKENGGILVQLKHENEKIKMVISDNGIGIPETVNYKNTETLGLQLVNTLTEQINGTISMKRNKGTIFEIIF